MSFGVTYPAGLAVYGDGEAIGLEIYGLDEVGGVLEDDEVVARTVCLGRVRQGRLQ